MKGLRQQVAKIKGVEHLTFVTKTNSIAGICKLNQSQIRKPKELGLCHRL